MTSGSTARNLALHWVCLRSSLRRPFAAKPLAQSVI